MSGILPNNKEALRLHEIQKQDKQEGPWGSGGRGVKRAPGAGKFGNHLAGNPTLAWGAILPLAHLRTWCLQKPYLISNRKAQTQTLRECASFIARDASHSRWARSKELDSANACPQWSFCLARETNNKQAVATQWNKHRVCWDKCHVLRAQAGGGGALGFVATACILHLSSSLDARPTCLGQTISRLSPYHETSGLWIVIRKTRNLASGAVRITLDPRFIRYEERYP